MKQWDIMDFPFEGAGPHPAVIISPDQLCSKQGHLLVNALICTTLRGGKVPGSHEVRLNGADGLDWASTVRCDVIYLLDKRKFGPRKGSVAVERRNAISRAIVESMNLRLR